MGNQQTPNDPKAPMKGGNQSGQSAQKGQKPGDKAGSDQQQQKSGEGSRESEHGSTRNVGNDQERAGDSGQKSHE